MTGTSTAVASASSALPMSADAPPSSSMSTTAWEPRKTVAHGKQHPLPPSVGPDRATSSAAMTRKLEEKALASEGEKAVPRSAARGETLPCSQDHDRWKELDGGDRLPPGEGSSDGLRNQQAEGVPRQENQRESTISGAEEHGVEREGGEGGGDRGAGRSRRRSLMGRMLESGMLERQKEWAKARRRKVRTVSEGHTKHEQDHFREPWSICGKGSATYNRQTDRPRDRSVKKRLLWSF